MTIHLRALAQFLRDVCAACRPPADDPCAPCDEYAAEFHRVVSEFAERMANRRVELYGDEDIAEWERELAHMAEGADE